MPNCEPNYVQISGFDEFGRTFAVGQHDVNHLHLFYYYFFLPLFMHKKRFFSSAV